MDLDRPRITLCIGETVEYRVIVNFESTQVGKAADTYALAHVKVEAYPDDKSVGTFIGSNKAGFAVQRTGANLQTPVSASFRFKAGKKAGATTLFFEGIADHKVDISQGYVSNKVNIRVIACRYKVHGKVTFPSLVTNAFTPYPKQVMVVDAEINADSEGHFSGTSALQWTARPTTGPTIQGVNCTTSQTFSSSGDVTINGEVNERGANEGKLTLMFTYTTATAVTVGLCKPGGSTSVPLSYVIDPIAVTVPVAGGKVRVRQGENQAQVSGSLSVTVTPVKG